MAEAPPASPDRYFHFPNVVSHDSLFRYAARLVLGAEPARTNKEAVLGWLRDAGAFLIDTCLDPILDKRRELRACLPDLIERARALNPEHIILISATVYDTAYWPFHEAGLPVVSVMVPFPGSGQQLRFEAEMRVALDSIGWNANGSGS